MVSFCANCNINADTLIASLASNAKECISDGVLTEIGDMVRDYYLNYIGSMIGHILIIYSLIQSKDSDFIDKTKESLQRSKRLHQIAYAILFADIVTEIATLEGVRTKDPSSFMSALSDGDHVYCDNKPIDEVDELKLILEEVAYSILVFRVCVAIVCSVLYVYIPLVQVKEEERLKKAAEESRPGLLMRLASFKSFRR